MNATEWRTLSAFVHHLGQEGIAMVDETEKGLFLTWIDRDPEAMARQRKLDKLNAFEVLQHPLSKVCVSPLFLRYYYTLFLRFSNSCIPSMLYSKPSEVP